MIDGEDDGGCVIIVDDDSMEKNPPPKPPEPPKENWVEPLKGYGCFVLIIAVLVGIGYILSEFGRNRTFQIICLILFIPTLILVLLSGPHKKQW